LLNYHFDLYNVCVPLYIRTGTIFFVCTKSEMSKLILRNQGPTDGVPKSLDFSLELVRGDVNRIPFQRVYLLFDEGFLNLFPLTLIDCPTVPSFAVAQAPFA